MLVSSSIWALVASEAGPALVIFAGVPGVLLLAGVVGLLSFQPWARRALLGGMVLGANNAFWTALFAFLTLEAARPGFGETLLGVSLGALVFFIILLVVLRAESVERHLWAVEMGKMGLNPDEVALQDEVTLDFGEEHEESRREEARARHDSGL